MRMTGRPNLEDLALLSLVARTGSIGQAAVELGVSQPSASRRVAALESALRVSLLQRSRRGTSLTPNGRVVVEWATTLLDAADDFTRSVESLKAQAVVTVRAAISMTIAEHHAPSWVARMHQRIPDYVVSLMVHNSTDVARLVELGEADVGFLESPTVRRSLRRRRFGWDVLAVAVLPEHEWARRQSVTAAELASAPLLVREAGSGIRETIERALQAKGLGITLGLEMASNTALKFAALAGIGPVVLSELALHGEFDTGALVRVAVTDLDLRRPLCAVMRRDVKPSAAVAGLLAVVTAPA